MKAVRRILLLSGVVLSIGLAVAYYNTSSLGYDNANIISFNNEEVVVFDISIKYDDVKNKIEKIKQIVPDKYVTI